MKVFNKFWELGESIKAIRGTRLMELINYVAQLQSSAVVAEIKPIPAIPVSLASPGKSNPVQLSLF